MCFEAAGFLARSELLATLGHVIRMQELLICYPIHPLSASGHSFRTSPTTVRECLLLDASPTSSLCRLSCRRVKAPEAGGTPRTKVRLGYYSHEL